ncbi:transposase [Sporolactobacillus shoreae]|uniref:Transposase n=1 Tax=Sporolactobacillus shoreae TaxID=1465501 RepID=A0A4Z0GRC9_9BACL|nr:RNA-guided endonuclease TnpB family protein [Sporolactobacillus shoreae]TGA98732.1 transposase [Sporolactobacillus shoreae]
MVTKGLKLRIYPNKQQRQQLAQNFGCTRFVWNQMLAMLNERQENNPKSSFLNAYALNNLLPLLKKEHPFLKEAESTSLQVTNQHLIAAFHAFFRKEKGHPKFKTKHAFKQSYTSKFVHGNIQPVGDHGIRLPKLGIRLPKLGILRFKAGQRIPETIKQVTLSRTPTGKYFAVLIVEGENQAFPKTSKTVGYDLGVKDLLVGSAEGLRWPTTRFDHGLACKLRLWQRKLARRQRLAKKAIAWDHHQKLPVPRTLADFKNVAKARLQVALIHEKIANQRADKLHKLTAQLVKTYDRIAMENLKTKNLLRNHTLARAIANQAWGELRRQLTYKCAWYSKELVLVNPYKTSQLCSTCGYDDGKKALAIREWTCPQCGTHHDRDVNAAKNIEHLAFG